MIAMLRHYLALYLWFVLFWMLWGSVAVGGIIAVGGINAAQEASIGLIVVVTLVLAGITMAVIDRFAVLPGTDQRRCPACASIIGWLVSECKKCGWHA